MSNNDNLGEYNTKEFIYISCNIVFSYFLYTCFKNILFQCLLYLLILCAEIYVLLVQNNYTSSYFYKCARLRNGVKDELLASLSPRFAPSQINSIFTVNRPILHFILQSVHLLYKYTIRKYFCFIRSLRINF